MCEKLRKTLAEQRYDSFLNIHRLHLDFFQRVNADFNSKNLVVITGFLQHRKKCGRFVG
jgi:hypothetical protein